MPARLVKGARTISLSARVAKTMRDTLLRDGVTTRHVSAPFLLLLDADKPLRRSLGVRVLARTGMEHQGYTHT
jgi:hypothetical protein